jgi:hypothetical protein
LIFGKLDAEELCAVPLVCSAWRTVELALQWRLWGRLATGWPASSAKQVVTRNLLFERRRNWLIDIDRIALEAPRYETSSDASAPLFCGLSPFFRPRCRCKCLIAGPNDSGKTRVLDTLVGRPDYYAQRAGSFHVETLMVAGVSMELWDGLRSLSGADALIFVCDGQEGAKDTNALTLLLDAAALASVPLLVVASKQDLRRRSPAQTAVGLGLPARGSLRWRVQPCALPSRSVAAYRGTETERCELNQGLRWLAHEIVRGAGRTAPSGALGRVWPVADFARVWCWLVRPR